MHKNLPTLEDVHYMDNITDLRNACRWLIRENNILREKLNGSS